MTNQQLFAKIWGQALKPEGYIEKNRCFFQYLPEKQLVKYIFMETLGNGKWCRISGDIQSFAGLVDPLDIRHQTLNSMDVMIPKLSGEPLDLIAYEFGKDAEQTLQNCLRTFFKYLFPKIKAVETVEDCYNYHLWSQKIVLNGIKGGMSLLFESYQTGHYRDTEHYLEILLQDAYSLWKQAQQRPLNTSFGKENLEKAEKYYAKVLQRYNEVKGEDYLHLQLALESRIAQSKQNCEHYFNPTNKKHKDS